MQTKRLLYLSLGIKRCKTISSSLEAYSLLVTKFVTKNICRMVGKDHRLQLLQKNGLTDGMTPFAKTALELENIASQVNNKNFYFSVLFCCIIDFWQIHIFRWF